jgi:hypothetical protein
VIGRSWRTARNPCRFGFEVIAMVGVTPLGPREVPTANVIQSLFDLNPAEARLAEAATRFPRAHSARAES